MIDTSLGQKVCDLSPWLLQVTFLVGTDHTPLKWGWTLIGHAGYTKRTLNVIRIILKCWDVRYFCDKQLYSCWCIISRYVYVFTTSVNTYKTHIHACYYMCIFTHMVLALHVFFIYNLAMELWVQRLSPESRVALSAHKYTYGSLDWSHGGTRSYHPHIIIWVTKCFLQETHCIIYLWF